MVNSMVESVSSIIGSKVISPIADRFIVVGSMGQMEVENARHMIKVRRGIIGATESIGEHNFIEMLKTANTGKVADSVISQFKMKKKSGAEISIVNFTEHPLSIFFEKGVKEHQVFASYNSVNGYSVRKWLDSKGLNDVNVFTVGGANSAMRKPGVMFMEKSFDSSWELSSAFFNKYLIKAIM